MFRIQPALVLVVVGDALHLVLRDGALALSLVVDYFGNTEVWGPVLICNQLAKSFVGETAIKSVNQQPGFQPQRLLSVYVFRRGPGMFSRHFEVLRNG